MGTLQGKKVVVTGGAGFIGSHTVDVLLREGAVVTVVDIRSLEDATNLSHYKDRVRYVRGDICDSELMRAVCSGQDYLVHLAAIASVVQSIEEPLKTYYTNVNGTLTVFEAARQADMRRVVYASSAAVYGDPEKFPITEECERSPLSPYALHKMTNEDCAHFYQRQHGIGCVGLRYFNVFGRRQDPDSAYSGVISIFSKKISTGEAPTIFGDGTTSRDFVHVSDVAQINCDALTADVSSEVFNIATGTETSMEELVKIMAKVKGISILPHFENGREGDILRSVASISKAEKELGFSPTCMLKEGIEDLLNTK